MCEFPAAAVFFAFALGVVGGALLMLLAKWADGDGDEH
jgi:hypothetical protein